MRPRDDQQEVEIQVIRRIERALDELGAHRRLPVLDFVRGRVVEELSFRGGASMDVPVGVNGA